jgi:hypothetical protein
MSGAVASFLSSLHATQETADSVVVNDDNVEQLTSIESIGANSAAPPSRAPLKQTAKDRVNFNELSQSSCTNHEELFALLQTTIARKLNVFAPKRKNLIFFALSQM